MANSGLEFFQTHFVRFVQHDGSEIFIRSDRIAAVMTTENFGAKARIDVPPENYYVIHTVKDVMDAIEQGERECQQP